MWQIMHWLVGTERVSVCVSGWPDSVLLIVGSTVCVRPSWPNFAYTPECRGSRSFAYTTWHDAQPECR